MYCAFPFGKQYFLRAENDHHENSYLLSIECVQAFDHPWIQLDGIGYISKNLFKRVCCLLVEQNPDCFPRLHSAPDDGDQFRPNEILILFCIWSTSFSSGKRWHWTRSRSCLNIHWPVWVYILGVLQFLEGFYGTTYITFPCENKSKSPASQIGEGRRKEQRRKIQNQIFLKLLNIILIILDLKCINIDFFPSQLPLTTKWVIY